jgi:hypothetical protein
MSRIRFHALMMTEATQNAVTRVRRFRRTRPTLTKIRRLRRSPRCFCSTSGWSRESISITSSGAPTGKIAKRVRRLRRQTEQSQTPRARSPLCAAAFTPDKSDYPEFGRGRSPHGGTATLLWRLSSPDVFV